MQKIEAQIPAGLTEQQQCHCEVHQNLTQLFRAAARELGPHGFTFQMQNGTHVLRILSHVAQKIGLSASILQSPNPWEIHSAVAPRLSQFFTTGIKK